MLEKQKGETQFEWKLRLCKAKLNKEIDLDWREIADLLKLNVSADHLRKTAYGLLEYDEYIHSGEGLTRILALSDFHIPFNLPIETFSDYVGRVDILVLNGDIVDMQAISKFPKAYRRSPIEEIIMARQYIIDLISYLKPCKVVATYGNHELRFESYLSKNLDTDLLELMPRTPLELIFNDGITHYNKETGVKSKYLPLTDVLENVEIVYVDDWKVKIGKTWFAHPIAYSSGTLKTCEKAMDYFFKVDNEPFDTVVLGHTHNVASTRKGNINLFEQGACCDVQKLNYADGKLQAPQKEGFIYIVQNNSGELVLPKTTLVALN